MPTAQRNTIAIHGNISYVCGPNRINIVDTSKVTAPVYVGEFGDADLVGNGGKCVLNTATSRPILVDIVGPNTAPTFAVYDLTIPTNPVKVAQQPAAPYTFITSLSFAGTVGFASTSWFEFSGNNITAQHGDFVAYDFSSLFPVLISALASGPGSSNFSVKPNSLALIPGNYSEHGLCHQHHVQRIQHQGARRTGYSRRKQSAKHVGR